MLSDLQQQILTLKKEKNAKIFAHSYQSPDILEIADLTGDSFALSAKAHEYDCDTIILCGVLFMAETLKMLCPEKNVILPVANATCAMADQIDPARVAAFKQSHPDYAVVAYINTSTQLKAVSDVCVTSSSAVKIVNALKQENILFIPDKNLGRFVQKSLPHKHIEVWEGCCPVHDAVTEEEVLAAKAAHPNAKILMHPELPPEVIRHADVAGSTADILRFAHSHSDDCIIGTEKSVADFLSITYPKRHFYALSKKLFCPDMRITNLGDVYHALKGDGGKAITLDESLRIRAKKPIDEMIRLGG